MMHVRKKSEHSVNARRPKFIQFMPLVAILLICLPPLLIGLGNRDTTHTMENVALVVSQETWLRHHDGVDSPWYLTYNDDRPRIVKPPMVTWQHFLAWADLDPATASPDQLIYRARLMAVLMGLLLIASVYWAGLTLHDVTFATGAALAVGTMLFFQRQSRTASYDIHFAAWSTLSIAAGLYAMAPRASDFIFPAEAGSDESSRKTRVPPRSFSLKSIFAWLLCALALAAAVYSKNPLAYPVVLLPLIAAIIVLPSRRRRAVFGFMTALAVSIALVLPWYIAVSQVQGAESRLTVEFQALRDNAQPIYYYIGVIALMLPWSIWLAPALAHPFMDGKRLGRAARLFVWLWFILIFILFSAHPTKQQRYILPIIGAAALLIAYVWRDHETMLRAGRTPRGYKSWVAIHGWSLLLVSLLFAPFLAAQQWLFESVLPAQWIERFDIDADAAGALPWPIAVVITIVLSALAVLVWRRHAQRQPMRAMFATGVWSIVFMTVFWHVYGQSPSGRHPIKPVAMQFRAEIGDAPIRSLRISGVDRSYILNEEFRFYFSRRLPWVKPNQLAAYADETQGEGLVLARKKTEHETALREAGYIPLRDVRTDDDVTQTLWHSLAPSSAGGDPR